jgi:hypothetical protein
MDIRYQVCLTIPSLLRCAHNFASLPCCVASMILLFLLLRGRIRGPQPSARSRMREWDTSGNTWVDRLLTVDVVGATLFISGGILLLLALSWGSTNHWNSARVIISFIFGGLLMIACVLWECVIEYFDDPKRGKAPPKVLEAEPLIPISIFYVRDTTICMFASFAGGMLMLVVFYFVAIFFTVIERIQSMMIDRSHQFLGRLGARSDESWCTTCVFRAWCGETTSPPHMEHYLTGL